MIIIYLFVFVFWILFMVLAFLRKKRREAKYFSAFAYFLFILGCAEAASVAGIYITTGEWIFLRKKNSNPDLFEPHPYLVGVPKKNVQKEINGLAFSHNASGFRGKEFTHKSLKKRIIAIGGSTTYGVGVSDNQTWPFFLDSILGENFEVLNFGVPGHSTVEHIILSSLYFSDYKPDLVIVQAGLNDLQNLSVPDLVSDYSDFHAPALFGALGFCYHNNLPASGLILAGVLLLEKTGWYPVCSFHKMKTNSEGKASFSTRPLELYRRNLHTLIVLCRQNNAEIIFVPQVSVKESFENNRMDWWIPFTESDSLMHYLEKYNKATAEIAESSNCVFAGNLLLEKWTYNDFADPSHFNSAGNLKLAKILAGDIRILSDNTTNKSGH